MEIETRARETEHMVSRLVEESERRRQEADDLKREVDIARYDPECETLFHSTEDSWPLIFREAERIAKDKLLSYISTASLTSMPSEQTLNGAGVISTMAGAAGLTPLSPSHNSLSAGNVSMLPNGHHMGGVFGGNYTNGFHSDHHHQQQQLPPPPDYGSQNSANAASAVGFPAQATSMNLDLSLASARLGNLSFSSPVNGVGGASLGTGALANGSTMGELLNASVSGASHTLMADAGRSLSQDFSIFRHVYSLLKHFIPTQICKT